MTSEQRDIIVEKMIDKPETLTNDEISMISSDAELKDLYEISSRLADELTSIPEGDIDTEWSKMHNLILGKTFKRKSYFRWMGIVAGIVVLLICGRVAVRYNLPAREEVSDIAIDIHYLTPEGKAYLDSLIEVNKSFEIKDNAIVENKDKRQSSKKLCIHSPHPSDNENSDIDEYLRIEQARVDNEVAMALAQVYREDFNVDLEELAEWLDSQSEESDSIIAPNINGIYINQLTML